MIEPNPDPKTSDLRAPTPLERVCLECDTAWSETSILDCPFCNTVTVTRIRVRR